MSGALFVHAEKNTFVGLSGGVLSDDTLVPTITIVLGKKMQNSYKALGFTGFGNPQDIFLYNHWGGVFDVRYGYHFLRTRNWSLGTEASALYGINSSYEGQYLALGGRIGLYTRLKISESVDIGFQIGIGGLMVGLFGEPEREWSFIDDDTFGYYVDVGLRHYF